MLTAGASCVHVLFTATKNGDQPLAVWRMIQKIAYSTPKQGLISHKVCQKCFFSGRQTLAILIKKDQ